jgi:hypothetical protein
LSAAAEEEDEGDLFAVAICQAGIPGRAEEFKAADKRGERPSEATGIVVADEDDDDAGVVLDTVLLDPCSSEGDPVVRRLKRRDLRDLISF